MHFSLELHWQPSCGSSRLCWYQINLYNFIERDRKVHEKEKLFYKGVLYYDSTQLNKALAAILEEDNLGANLRVLRGFEKKGLPTCGRETVFMHF